MLRQSTALAVGGGAAAILPGMAEASSPGLARAAYVGAVNDDGAVQLQGESDWLATAGFPSGWVINVGDRLAVLAPPLSGQAQSVAVPLGHWETGQMTDGALAPAPGEAPMEAEAATIYIGSLDGASASQGGVEVFVADQLGGGAGRAMAIRES